jgi:(p)ppGpp synthase/HD superfamily hydrolase
MIEKAREFAREAHKGQKYGDHDYFDYHICGVVKYVERVFSNRTILDKIIVTAYLHDVVEDTDYTIGYITEEFGGDIGYFVDLLTKRDGELYDSYMEHLFRKECFVANAVKYSDLSFNIENCRKRYESGVKHSKHMLEKYLLARMMLHKKIKWSQEY